MAVPQIQDELAQRLTQIERRVHDLRLEAQEVLELPRAAVLVLWPTLLMMLLQLRAALSDTHSRLVQAQCQPHVDLDELLRPGTLAVNTSAPSAVATPTVVNDGSGASDASALTPTSSSAAARVRIPRESEESVTRRKQLIAELEDEYMTVSDRRGDIAAH